MARLSVFQHVISVCFVIVFLGSSSDSRAGSLAESFKNFVLGAEAQASATHPVQFPPASRASTCMQCHDGTGASQVHLKPAGAPIQYRGQMITGHPVGMNYSHYAAKNPAIYTRPAALDKRVVLENGEVTCLSCHRTRSRDAADRQLTRLEASRAACNVAEGYTTGMTQTGLCMACHTM